MGNMASPLSWLLLITLSCTLLICCSATSEEDPKADNQSLLWSLVPCSFIFCHSIVFIDVYLGTCGCRSIQCTWGTFQRVIFQHQLFILTCYNKCLAGYQSKIITKYIIGIKFSKKLGQNGTLTYENYPLSMITEAIPKILFIQQENTYKHKEKRMLIIVYINCWPNFSSELHSTVEHRNIYSTATREASMGLSQS